MPKKFNKNKMKEEKVSSAILKIPGSNRMVLQETSNVSIGNLKLGKTSFRPLPRKK